MTPHESLSGDPSLPEITLVVAHDKNRLIGGQNTLLWHLPDDLQHFKKRTSGGAIVMGRLTFDSIGRPLPHRFNAVVSQNPHLELPGAHVYPDLRSALDGVKKAGYDRVFVVGGGTLYAQCLPLAQRLEITVVDAEYTGDTWFPAYEEDPTWLLREETHHPADERHPHSFVFRTYVRRNVP